MTRDEFKAAAFVLEGGWPGEFTTDEENAYYFLLSDFGGEQVMRALKAMRRSKFRPSASEIALVLTPGAAGLPTFPELMVLLDRVLYVRAHGWFASAEERSAAHREKRDGLLTGMHPVAAAFIQRHGDRWFDVSLVGEDGKWNRKELAGAWDAHCDAFEGREVAVLASGGGQAVLRQLDPLGVLGLPAGQHALPGART